MNNSDHIHFALTRAAATLATLPAMAIIVDETGLCVRDLRILLGIVDAREVSPSVRAAMSPPAPLRTVPRGTHVAS